MIAAEIVEDLEDALAEFSELAESLEGIGLDIHAELLDELAGRVPEGRFRCAAVECAIPDSGFRFRRVAVLPRGRAGTSPTRSGRRGGGRT